MNDECKKTSDEPPRRISIPLDGLEIAVALLFIAFWGEPDLIDAIIAALMR